MAGIYAIPRRPYVPICADMIKSLYIKNSLDNEFIYISFYSESIALITFVKSSLLLSRS